MLEAIKELGDCILDRKNKDKLTILLEPLYKANQEEPRLLTIDIDITTAPQYLGISIEPYRTDKNGKYLYKKGSPRGANFSPTTQITDTSRTYQIKILGWFRDFEKIKDNFSKEDQSFIQALHELLKEKEKEIVSNLEEKRKETNISCVTLRFRKENKWLYLGDLKVFKDFLLKKIFEREAKIAGQNKICSLCKQRKTSVFLDSSIFKFFNIDKPGFITGGFIQEDAWHMFPLCPDCKLSLVEGKNFLQNLQFTFVKGMQYFLIPHFLLGKEQVRKEILDILLDAQKRVTLSKESKKNITTDEEDILFYLKEAEDTISFYLLFLKKEQSAERILLLIEDVLPSRLQTIFKAKDKVDGKFEPLNYNFSCLREFFFKTDEKNKRADLDKYFLEVIDKVFKGRTLSLSWLLQFFMHEIRKDFFKTYAQNDNYRFQNSVRYALMNLDFFTNLGLLPIKSFKEEGMFDVLYEKYQLNSVLKRGLFLLGALTELLLQIQRAKRDGSMPFFKQLKGLKMNESEIKGLLPKVINKFIEYDSYGRGKRLLAEEVSKNLLNSGSNWKITLDEINFYFAAGMALASEVKEMVENTGGRE